MNTMDSERCRNLAPTEGTRGHFLQTSLDAALLLHGIMYGLPPLLVVTRLIGQKSEEKKMGDP